MPWDLYTSLAAFPMSLTHLRNAVLLGYSEMYFLSTSTTAQIEGPRSDINSSPSAINIAHSVWLTARATSPFVYCRTASSSSNDRKGYSLSVSEGHGRALGKLVRRLRRLSSSGMCRSIMLTFNGHWCHFSRLQCCWLAGVTV